ncbi:MAG: hypothetical protein KKF44_02440 [Nanoarchaeota archaeon]|nr:hypothetical protein [Nanoarchaeota archaeon]
MGEAKPVNILYIGPYANQLKDSLEELIKQSGSASRSLPEFNIITYGKKVNSEVKEFLSVSVAKKINPPKTYEQDFELAAALDLYTAEVSCSSVVFDYFSDFGLSEVIEQIHSPRKADRYNRRTLHVVVNDVLNLTNWLNGKRNAEREMIDFHRFKYYSDKPKERTNEIAQILFNRYKNGPPKNKKSEKPKYLLGPNKISLEYIGQRFDEAEAPFMILSEMEKELGKIEAVYFNWYQGKQKGNIPVISLYFQNEKGISKKYTLIHPTDKATSPQYKKYAQLLLQFLDEAEKTEPIGMSNKERRAEHESARTLINKYIIQK